MINNNKTSLQCMTIIGLFYRMRMEHLENVMFRNVSIREKEMNNVELIKKRKRKIFASI